MISEEKVKIMAEMARYEKNHGKDDFRVYKYEKKDYIRLEQIKTSICLLIAYLILTGLLCVVKMDTVIMNLRDGKIIILAAVVLIIYIAVYLIYSHFIKKRAARHYDEVRARVLIYDKHLEELEMLYKVEENEDVSPTIAPEEDEDGKIIDIYRTAFKIYSSKRKIYSIRNQISKRIYPVLCNGKIIWLYRFFCITIFPCYDGNY